MATFDYFVGPVQCSSCSHVCTDVSSNMQTKLSKQPSLAELSAGSQIDANWDNVCETGYLKIKEPFTADSVVILESWECPNCDKPSNWAKVVISKSVVEDVGSVDLTVESIESAHYVTEDCRFLLDSPKSLDKTVGALVEQLSTQSE